MWPDAPVSVAHLRNQHRHVFVIRCWWEVSHNEREIEIQMQEHQVEDFLRREFPSIPMDFGDLSCESIAEMIMEHFGPSCVKCQVLEDGYGGASLSR